MPVATPSKRRKELESEITLSEHDLAQFTKNNPFTGAINDDIGKLIATRHTRQGIAAAKKSLNDEFETSTTARGQDLSFALGTDKNAIDKLAVDADNKKTDAYKELGLGEIAVRKDSNSIQADSVAKQHEISLGELNLNKDIFNQSLERYKTYGEPADLFALTERAANTRVGAEQAGLELSDDLLKATEKYLKPENKNIDPVATPVPAVNPAPEEPELVSRASIIGQYIQEGTGIANPHNTIVPAIKQGREIGRNIKKYLFEPTIRRRVKKSQ